MGGGYAAWQSPALKSALAGWQGVVLPRQLLIVLIFMRHAKPPGDIYHLLLSNALNFVGHRLRNHAHMSTHARHLSLWQYHAVAKVECIESSCASQVAGS